MIKNILVFCNSYRQENFIHKKVIERKPNSEEKTPKYRSSKKTEIIRVNLVEMSGELPLHKHPDAEHSLVLLDGRVKVLVDDSISILEKNDFISIPQGVPHKFGV